MYIRGIFFFCTVREKKLDGEKMRMGDNVIAYFWWPVPLWRVFENYSRSCWHRWISRRWQKASYSVTLSLSMSLYHCRTRGSWRTVEEGDTFSGEGGVSFRTRIWHVWSSRETDPQTTVRIIGLQCCTLGAVGYSRFLGKTTPSSSTAAATSATTAVTVEAAVDASFLFFRGFARLVNRSYSLPRSVFPVVRRVREHTRECCFY